MTDKEVELMAEVKRLKEQLRISGVSNQRELLIAFKSWEINKDVKKDVKNLTIEQTIDLFIESN